MAMTEPGISAPASPSDVGRHLRAVRKSKGLSRAEVARSAGLTRRELAAYERGRSPVPDSDLWCLAGSCGVDVGELVPTRVGVSSDLGALTVGESVARLRAAPGSGGVLREYLAMVYELRNLPPGTRPPMREEDLATLAEALGGTPEAIEARLHELIGASREEAARLRGMILPPRPIAATGALPDFGAGLAPPTAMPMPAVAPFPVAVGVASADPFGAPPSFAMPAPPTATTPVAPPPFPTAPPGPGLPPLADPAFAVAPAPGLPTYPPPAFDFATPAPSIGDPAAADRFFGAPVADDPFAPPPPLEGFAPPGTPAASPPGGFGPPTTAPIDPFAPPTGPPLAAFPPPTDVAPIGEPLRPAGFVADLGDPAAPPTPAAYDPPGTDWLADHDVDPRATEPEPTDPSGGWAEMVVLDVGPDGLVIDDPATGADPEGSFETFETFQVFEPFDDEPRDAVDTVDTLDPADDADDPFAVLRVPLDEDAAFAGTAFAGDDSGAATAEAAGAFAAEGVLDAEPVVVVPDVLTSPLTDDGEPTDDWFDRAAAAADALIAEQRHDELGPIDSSSSDSASSDPFSSDPSPLDPVPEAVADPAPLAVGEPGTEPPLAAEPGVGPDADPIAWSLVPPAASIPDVAPPVAEPASGEFVAAGTAWEVGGIFPATAMADDGTLALRRADVRWALADLLAEGDFTLRATVHFTSGAGFGLLFRVSTDDSERITGYSFDVDPVYSGGGFLLRQWNDSRQHWKPLAHAPVADTARLYGAHVIEMQLRHDTLVASIDGETVLSVPQLSRRSIEAGHEPCRGGRVGVQAWSTTEVTVDRLLLAHH